MELNHTPFYLQFKHPFGVSSNTRKETVSVFVKLDAEGVTGYGEACLPAYLGETVADTSAFFEKMKSLLKGLDLSLSQDLIVNTDRVSDRHHAGKAALDMAMQDLAGKLAAKPYYEMAGIAKSEPAVTSFTIGISEPAQLERKIAEAADFRILKIKAGTPDDQALIILVLKFTDKPLYVDVNQGWRDRQKALNMLNWLNDQNVVLVEQPMPREMAEEMSWLTARSPIPTIADESIRSFSELERIGSAFHGINVKLMKCGGLSEALKMIAFCRKNGLKVMLGCMAESSCATSAMAQLMGLADFIDLDAPLLYNNDPFSGVTYSEGKIHLNGLPGLGVSPHGDVLI